MSNKLVCNCGIEHPIIERELYYRIRCHKCTKSYMVKGSRAIPINTLWVTTTFLGTDTKVTVQYIDDKTAITREGELLAVKDLTFALVDDTDVKKSERLDKALRLLGLKIEDYGRYNKSTKMLIDACKIANGSLN